MKFFLPFFLFFNIIFANVTYTGVHFTNQEINLTLAFVNHASYTDLYNVLRDKNKVNDILWFRYDHSDEGGFTSIKQLVDLAIDYRYLNDLKLYSYKWDSDLIVKPIDTTYPLTNFLYALTGILIGFTIFFVIILHFAR